MSISRELSKEHLQKKHAENLHQKLAQDPSLILLNNPKQPLHVRNSFKKSILKKGYQKALKKLTLIFLLNPILFKGQSYQKQKGTETSHQLLLRSQNKFRKIPVFVIYYLTKFDDIMESSFRVILKITSASLCK